MDRYSKELAVVLHIIWMIILGLIVGGIARLIVPGRHAEHVRLGVLGGVPISSAAMVASDSPATAAASTQPWAAMNFSYSLDLTMWRDRG
jgi:hypothetical protein